MLDVGRWMFEVRQLFIRNGFMTTTLDGFHLFFIPRMRYDAGQPRLMEISPAV